MLHALEVKSGSTIAADFLRALERFRRAAGRIPATLVYGGEIRQARTDVSIYGWRDIAAAARRLLG